MCRCTGAGRSYPGVGWLSPVGFAGATRLEPGSRALFFTYFAYVGVMGPYFGLWLESRGYSIVQIGLLLSLPQWLRMVAPPFWGWWADRTGRPIALLRLSAVLSLALVLMLPAMQQMPELIALMLALGFISAAQGPIGEALALAQSGGDPGRYGRIRLWGSVGYILTVTAGGWWLDRTGMTAVPWMMASGLASFAVVTWLMRDAPAARAVARARVPLGHRLREPAVMAFLVSAFLMVCAHGALYAFWSLYLERQGYSRTAIGVIWAVGVLAEIALFAWQRRLFQRFDAMRLLQMSFIVCALRFAVVGAIDAMPLWCVIATQLLHAITFGVHHSASMAVLHRWFEPSQQAQAQAAYIVVAWGMGGGVGGSLAAWLWSQASPGAAFLGAAVTALLGWVAVTVAARYPVRP